MTYLKWSIDLSHQFSANAESNGTSQSTMLDCWFELDVNVAVLFTIFDFYAFFGNNIQLFNGVFKLWVCGVSYK